MSKFLVDFDALEKVSSKMQSGGGKYFPQQAIPENGEVNIRIMPPLPSLNGYFYLHLVSYWINGTNYISPETFGLPCPIAAAIKDIEKSDDDELHALLDDDKFSRKEEYLMSALLLDVEYKQRKLHSVDVLDDELKIFKCSYSVIKQLNAYVSHQQYQNGTALGVFDADEGYNFIIGKEVKGKQTSYKVMPWTKSYGIDEEWFEDVPDLVATVKKRLYQDSYLQGVVDNYFYDEDMPDDSTKFSKSTKKKKKKKLSEVEESVAPSKKIKKKKKKVVEEAEPPIKKKKKSAPPAMTKPGSKNLLDVLADEEE